MIGVCSNVPSFEDIKIFGPVLDNDRNMVNDFVDYLLSMSDKSFKLNKKRLGPLFKDIWKLRVKHAKHGSR